MSSRPYLHHQIPTNLYHSMYLPKRLRRKYKKESQSKLGYFFISLTDIKYTPMVTQLLAGKPFGGPCLASASCSTKNVEVSWASGTKMECNNLSSKATGKPSGGPDDNWITLSL